MSERAGPLEGIVVVDLTRVLAGPYLTMVMADLGARVIKVEVPEIGDDARHFGPYVEGESAYFASINRGKESIALNLKNHDDREVFEALLKKADVVVENYRAGTMQKLDYGWDKLKSINNRLIYAAVSGFGQTGPYSPRAAYDMVVQAMGGIISLTGSETSGPIRVGTSVGDITAGLFGLSGVLAALYDRERTGEGSMIDVGMLDCQVAILENAISRYFASGEVPQPMGMCHPSITPFDGFKVGDQYIVIAAGNDALFRALCKSLGEEPLADDPRFASNELRNQNQPQLKVEIERLLQSDSLESWLQILDAAGVPCGPINNVKQVVENEHVQARNMIISATNDAGLTTRMAGNPIKFGQYKDVQSRPAAPQLDVSRKSVLDWLGISE